jgi:hypothetical protein
MPEVNKKQTDATPTPETLMIQVRGQEPLSADAPVYSNFLAVSRVGADVEFEFVFLDFNAIAKILEESMKGGANSTPAPIEGKTVAKVIVPGLSLIQIREHLNFILNEVEKAMKDVKSKSEMEAHNESSDRIKST